MSRYCTYIPSLLTQDYPVQEPASLEVERRVVRNPFRFHIKQLKLHVYFRQVNSTQSSLAHSVIDIVSTCMYRTCRYSSLFGDQMILGAWVRVGGKCRYVTAA